MTIYFYSKTEEYGFLSNFAPFGFHENGRRWKTVEHYFQAMKFTDESHIGRICDASTPKEARELGQSRKVPIRADWDAARLEVMRRAVELKFIRNPEILERLMETGEEELIENSPFDYYWGIGKTGTGENRLGRILMEFRAAQRKGP